MDIRPAIAKIVSDCDQRNRFVRQVPGALDFYQLSHDGEIIKYEPPRKECRHSFGPAIAQFDFNDDRVEYFVVCKKCGHRSY